MEKRNVLAVAFACALCTGAAAGCSSDDGGGDVADEGSAQGAADLAEVAETVAATMHKIEE